MGVDKGPAEPLPFTGLSVFLQSHVSGVSVGAPTDLTVFLLLPGFRRVGEAGRNQEGSASEYVLLGAASLQAKLPSSGPGSGLLPWLSSLPALPFQPISIVQLEKTFKSSSPAPSLHHSYILHGSPSLTGEDPSGPGQGLPRRPPKLPFPALPSNPIQCPLRTASLLCF